MTCPAGRALVSLILAPSLAFTAIMVPEHLHEADADHPRQTVHRHLQPHAPVSDDDHAQLADDDGHVVWLGQVATSQRGFQDAAPVVVPSEGFELAPEVPEPVMPPDVVTAPAHGPPKAPAALRAPPLLPV